MSKKHIREVAKEYGISLKGLTLFIDKDIEKLASTFKITGRADTQTIGRIDFYPKAFASKEELLRTLYHEKIHVEQFKEFGSGYVQDNRMIFERETYGKEKEFIEALKQGGRL